MAAGPFFINRDSGALIRVSEVDTSYAYYETVYPSGQKYSMPLADYDSVFVEIFRPATEAELSKLANGNYRAPANAPASWK